MQILIIYLISIVLETSAVILSVSFMNVLHKSNVDI